MTEPSGGFPGDAEGGGWSGDPSEQFLTAGGQIASRGVGDIPLPADAPSVVDSIGEWQGASWGSNFYEVDTSGNRVGPVARPGE